MAEGSMHSLSAKTVADFSRRFSEKTLVIRGPKRQSLRLFPLSQTRPPSAHVAAVFVILPAEFSVQSWLFVEHHEQMDCQRNPCDRGDEPGIVVAEDYPQTSPSGSQAHIHRIADIAIEAHNY